MENDGLKQVDSSAASANRTSSADALMSHAQDLRREGQNASSWTDSYHRVVDAVPATVAGLASFGTGMAARLPGYAGLAGKIGLAAISGIYGTDAAMRFFDKSGTQDNSSAYLRDSAVMLSGAGGWLTGGFAGLNRSSKITAANDVPLSSSIINESRVGTNLVTDVPFGQAGSRTVVDGLSSEGVAAESTVVKFTGKFRTPPKMIEEAEIAALPAEQQLAVRTEIDALVKKGVDPKYLSLSKSGRVLHDVEAEGDAITADFFKKKP